MNGGLLQFTSGTFNLTDDNLTVGSTGILGSTVVLSSPKTLNVTNATTIDASGELELDGGRFSSGTLTNHGLIGGDGRIDAPLANAADGTVRALTGEHQRFTGSARTMVTNNYWAAPWSSPAPSPTTATA